MFVVAYMKISRFETFLLCCIGPTDVSERPKPYVNNQNEEQRALRFVAKQPLRFENGEFNLRKLMQLPYHMIQAREVSALKSQTLCNFDFLVSKLQATSYG